MTVGAAILSPTRSYAPVIADLLGKMRGDIHGMIHCTGGGLVKCRNFGKGVRYVKDDLISVPPLFRAIYESGAISLREMYQTFNMGCRLEIILPADKAQAVIDTARRYEIAAKVIGRVERADGSNKVELRDAVEGRTFEY